MGGGDLTLTLDTRKGIAKINSNCNKTMKTTPKHTASLPFFPGFYNSDLSALIDWEEENEMENTGETYEQIAPRLDYAAAHDSLAYGWAERFSAETGLAMKFESLDSPREYNFTTDRVFVVLAPEALEKLESLRGTPELAEVLKEMFTSYSGFHSFYSPDPEDERWQVPVAEMDCNQLEAYLAAWVLRESGETLRGARKDLCESILEFLSGNGYADAVWKRVAPVAEVTYQVKADYKRGSRYNGKIGVMVEESEHTVTLRFPASTLPVCFHKTDVECDAPVAETV